MLDEKGRCARTDVCLRIGSLYPIAVDGGRGDVGRAPRIGIVKAETTAKEIHQTAGDV